MESPKNVLEIFSPLLIFEYIRLMTVAAYVKDDKQPDCVKFKIKAADYERLWQEPLQTALIGLETHFENNVLTAVPSAKCLQQYTNKVMKEGVLQYAENYGKRYENYITVIE